MWSEMIGGSFTSARAAVVERTKQAEKKPDAKRVMVVSPVGCGVVGVGCLADYLAIDEE
jgi:hypothetical protein